MRSRGEAQMLEQAGYLLLNDLVVQVNGPAVRVVHAPFWLLQSRIKKSSRPRICGQAEPRPVGHARPAASLWSVAAECPAKRSKTRYSLA